MSNSDGPQPNSPTASQPIINIIDAERAQSISWEVKDSNDIEIPQEEEKPKEDLPQEEESIQENDNGEVQEDNQKEKKKPLRAPKDKRFATFTRKLKLRDELLQEKDAQLRYYEQQLALREKEKLVAETKYIGAEINKIEKAHEEALAEGDFETATKAASLLAQYSARLESYAQQKHNMDIERNVQRPQQTYQETPDNPEVGEEFHINGKEWLAENPWADAKSINYSPKMLNVAEEYVEMLIEQYKYQKRAEDIGSPEFFNQITEHVRETFGFSPQPSKPQKNKLVMKGSNTPSVAPVNRSATMNTPGMASRDIVLTPEQIQMAHKMSGRVYHNGQRVTDNKTLEAIYKANLIQQTKRG
jgi:hypothetical protein